MIDVLQWRSTSQAEAIAYTFLADDESLPPEALTFAQLDRAARALASVLARDCAPGERALLLYAPGLDFIVGFLGCLYAGVIAVPVYPPRRNQNQQRLMAIVADCRPRAVLTTADIITIAQPLRAENPALAALDWIASDRVDASENDWRPPTIDRAHLAFLQYTSGSTGKPKGVMVSHGNLFDNSRAMYRGFGLTPQTQMVSWLPHFHDMGLILGLLQSLYGGFSTTFMAPASFMQKPRRWLQAISGREAVIAGAPNFAYDLCVRALDDADVAALDLRGWQVAFNGAEPVHADTLRAFTQKFAAAGFRAEAFYPCFGMAEVTLYASGGDPGSLPVFHQADVAALRDTGRLQPPVDGAAVQTLVGCGHAGEGLDIVIVDPANLLPCPEKTIGEIWLKGSSVAQGYWEQTEISAETFDARLADGGDGPFLRTGDLGVLVGRELYVTGRLKDLIIIRGRNYYPQDIERVAETSHPGLRAGNVAAFSVEAADGEQLVIVQEVERTAMRTLDPDAAMDAIARAVTEEFEIAPHAIVLVRPATILKTSSGKIQRRATRASFLDGTLAVIAERRRAASASAGDRIDRATLLEHTRDERARLLAAALHTQIAALLDTPVARIPLDQPFDSLGLDSLSMTQFAGRLAAQLGIDVALDEVFNAAGIDALAVALCARLEEATQTWPAVEPVAGAGDVPLSFAQSRIWFLDRLAPDSAFYNLPIALRIAGDVDLAALQRALAEMISRHDMLRTVFLASEGEAVQRVVPTMRVSPQLRTLAPSESLADVLRSEAAMPFDLAVGPPLRLLLVQVAPNVTVLLITAHHIVTDGWSVNVMAQEIAALYRAARGEQPPPAPLAIQYRDYTVWQHAALTPTLSARQLAYWREQLAGLPALFTLPGDYPRPRQPAYRGAQLRVAFPAALRAGVQALAQRTGTTGFMTLLAAFYVVLYRSTGRNDLCVGTPIANRRRPELETLIGFFANTLALRLRFAHEPSFTELLAQVRELTTAAYAHQDVPFEHVVDALKVARQPGCSPLFQIMFVVQRSIADAFDGTGLAVDYEYVDSGTAKFDLTVQFFESKQGLEETVLLEYSTELYRRETIEALFEDFTALLERALENPHLRLSALCDATDKRPAVARNATVAAIEDALGARPEFAAVAVSPRQTENAAEEYVAFLVPAQPLSREDIDRLLDATLEPALRPQTWVGVTALPHAHDGRIDRLALTELPVVDERLATRWQAAAEAVSDVREVVVACRSAPAAQSALHLADLIPGWRAHASPVAAAAANPAPEVEPAPDAQPALHRGAALQTTPQTPRVLPEVLAQAAKTPRGIRFIDADGDREISYAALLERAQRILGGLRAAGLRAQDTLIFQFPRNEDFIAVFWACQLGGLVPVPLAPAPSYVQANAQLNRLDNAWQMLDRPLILTSRALAADIRGARFASAGSAPRVAIIEELARSAADTQWHIPAPDDLALLLLTSGSTGLPKAVMQSHAALIARALATQQHNGFTSAEISLNWMPLDHVGGIVMFHLHDTFIACSQIQVATQVILEEPLRWLALVEQHRVTLTWAPNFAFALINDHAAELARRRFDLRSLRFILNGGEAIVARTTRRFLSLLAPHGLPATAMHPAWGMSETCSGVTFSDTFTLDSTHDDDVYVEVGEPIPGFALRIVDDTHAVVAEGRIGRLQVQGPSVTTGYYQNSSANQEAFCEGWFETGDLGLIRAGRLTITGRAKDVIIVNGVNYPAHEIEATVEVLADVAPSFTAAVAVREPGTDTDKLAIFFHARGATGNALPVLIARIRAHVIETIGLNPDYLLPVAAERIPKTEIGKIQRTQLRQRFEAGEFADVIAALELPGDQNTLPAWFFERTWRRRAMPDAAPFMGTVLIVGADGALTDALAKGLRDMQLPVVGVEPGPGYARLDASHFHAATASADDYRQILTALDAPPAAILHLGGYGARTPVATPADLRQAQTRGVHDVASLLRALDEVGPAMRTPPLRFIAVTSDLQAIGDAPVAYEKAGLVGLLASAAAELDWLEPQLIDLDFAESAAAAHAAQVIDELGVARPEPEVAYRDGQRFVPRLSPAAMATAASPIRRGGLYLVTGGLGGIGRQVAAWLMQKFDARLLLIGRSVLPARETWPGHLAQDTPEARRLKNLMALESIAPDVLYEAADSLDPAAVSAAIGRAEAQWQTPLAGVFHLAGEAMDLAQYWQSAEQHRVTAESIAAFEQMAQAKVYGTWALGRVLDAYPDAAWFAFSSVNGVFGGANFGAYAAANSVLDAFTLDQRARGRASFGFNWTMWDDTGMSRNTPAFARAASRAMGYHILSLEQGLQSLEAGLHRAGGQLIVGLDAANASMQPHIERIAAPLDAVHVYACATDEALTELHALQVTDRFGRATRACIVPVAEMPRTSAGEIDIAVLLALAEAAPDAAPARVAPRNAAETALAQIWSEVLGVAAIGVFDNFFQLGGNSLRATRIVAQVRAQMNAELQVRLLFEQPTIAGLAAALEGAQATQDTRIERSDAWAEQRLASLDEMSEAEIEALLLSMADDGAA